LVVASDSVEFAIPLESGALTPFSTRQLAIDSFPLSAVVSGTLSHCVRPFRSQQNNTLAT